jgi:hypothetical protein
MILWHKHCDICDAWLCEGVIYHTSDGIPSLMTNYGSPIFSTYKTSLPFLGPRLMHRAPYMT